MRDKDQETAAQWKNGDAWRPGFDCCSPRMADAMPESRYWCGSILRRHRVAAFTICTILGLALLAIPVGVILGIIAFLRTI